MAGRCLRADRPLARQSAERLLRAVLRAEPRKGVAQNRHDLQLPREARGAFRAGGRSSRSARPRGDSRSGAHQHPRVAERVLVRARDARHPLGLGRGDVHKVRAALEPVAVLSEEGTQRCSNERWQWRPRLLMAAIMMDDHDAHGPCGMEQGQIGSEGAMRAGEGAAWCLSSCLKKRNATSSGGPTCGRSVDPCGRTMRRRSTGVPCVACDRCARWTAVEAAACVWPAAVGLLLL